MSNKSNANALSDILRYMADKLEKNPDLVDNLKIEVKIKPEKTVNEKIGLSDYDSEEQLYNALKRKNIEKLKLIIKENKLGTNYSISKLQNKEEIMKFIIKRVNDRYHKGDSFIITKDKVD